MSDSYNWLGMHETALALREAGMEMDGEKWLREANDYRDDILASMQAALVDVGGFKALPVEPLTRRLLKEGGGDYYGLIAPAILETEIFSPEDEKTFWITKYMDKRGGLLLGLARFADGVDHAYTYGYALTQLRKRNVDQFLLTFYSMLAYGMSRGTYSAVEVSYLPYGINELTLPHTYSNTQQLRMLRMMLVKEEGDDLWLAFGTPRAWLEDGKSLWVKGAPTPYEPLSSTGDRIPNEAKLRIRVPVSLGNLKSVTVNGNEWRSFHDDLIHLKGPMLKQRLEIVARYQGS